MDFLVLTDIHQNWAHLTKMISLAEEYDGVIYLGDLLKHDSNEEVISKAIQIFSKIHEASKFMVGIPGNGAVPKLREYFENLGINTHRKSHILGNIGFFGVGGTPDPVALILTLRTFFKNETRPAIDLPDKALETLEVFGVSIIDGVFAVEEWSERQVNLLNRYRGPFEHTEEEIFDFLVQGYQTISNCSVRILMSHVPPYEPIMNAKFPEGVSTGSRGITKFIKQYSPSVALSGHYHISHKFEIGPVPCFIFPAVVDGFYSVLSIDQRAQEFTVTVKTF